MLVFLVCLLSIATRMPGTLAVFWPTNALLLGLLLRNPTAATLPTWVGAAAGYLLADLITGSDLHRALLLNSANIVGVLVGFYGFRRVRNLDLTLARASSVTWVAAVSVTAAGSAATVGGFIDVALFGDSWTQGASYWFAYEFLNYTVLLPLVLSAPAIRLQTLTQRPCAEALAQLRRRGRQVVIPLVLLLATAPVAWMMGGLGAFTFSMPALIAAALLGHVFITTLFIAVATAWGITLAVYQPDALPTMTAEPISISTLIGLALLAGGPLVIACTTTERKRIYAALHRAMTRDDLTRAYRRDEFMRRADTALAEAAGRSQPVALLMMDLDHFKRLNDTFGHGAGDRALADFAETVRDCTDDTALFARMGGEEFALLLPEVSRAAAVDIAEQIRSRQSAATTGEFGELGATVSVGLVYAWAPLVDLLAAADAALYRAKSSRRNSVVIADDPDPIVTV